MKTAIRQLEFKPENYPGETIDEISETIPGQAYSVSEVLIKFTQGTIGNIGMPNYYDYEDEIEIDDDAFNSYDPTLSPDFDLSDAEEYLRIRNEDYAEYLKEKENKAKPGDKQNLKQENQTEEEES